MKRKFLTIAAVLAVGMTCIATAKSHDAADEVMTKLSDGTYVVNTTTLCPEVEGFKGATPLNIYIKKNRVVKIEALPNHETPRFFAKVKQGLLDKWNGMKVSKAKSVQVDGATGATYSSDAVKENVARGLQYYQQNKSKLK